MAQLYEITHVSRQTPSLVARLAPVLTTSPYSLKYKALLECALAFTQLIPVVRPRLSFQSHVQSSSIIFKAPIISQCAQRSNRQTFLPRAGPIPQSFSALAYGAISRRRFLGCVQGGIWPQPCGGDKTPLGSSRSAVFVVYSYCLMALPFRIQRSKSPRWLTVVLESRRKKTPFTNLTLGVRHTVCQ